MSTIRIKYTDIMNRSVQETTAIIQKAINQLDQEQGGHLILEAGEYSVSSLALCSHLTFELESGARLKFSDQPDDYPVVTSRWEGATQKVYRACLYGKNLHNVRIIGGGIVDGNGARWWKLFKAGEIDYPRPYLLSIENSYTVQIKDLTFVNSPAWTLHPMLSENVKIQNVTVINPKNSPNTDGLDPESCKNVIITGCTFDVGDDCIAIKAGTEDAQEMVPCENLVISNCNMVHGHGGVVFGSEMSGSIKNVTITGCTFQDTDRGLRFKTRRGRGGTISEVNVTNIVMDNVLCPLIVNTYYFCGKAGKEKYVWTKEKLPADERTPYVKHVRFSNLIATNIRSCVAFVYGLPEAPIEDLTLNDSSFSLSPDSTPEAPAMIANAPEFAQGGLFVENTQNCTFKNLQITGAKKVRENVVNNDELEMTV